MPVFDLARRFMRENGNMNQWTGGYPSESQILEDIKKGNLYVEENEEGIQGVFAFIVGEEPTYREIDGEWLNERPYGTIHRLASNGRYPGFADRCFAFCAKIHAELRADTHADNLPMQRGLERNGFRYCGIIHLEDGAPRKAYHRPE